MPQVQQAQHQLAWEWEQRGTREGQFRLGLCYSSSHFFNALVQVGETLVVWCGNRVLL